jgi:hypothetical protein
MFFETGLLNVADYGRKCYNGLSLAVLWQVESSRQS